MPRRIPAALIALLASLASLLGCASNEIEETPPAPAAVAAAPAEKAPAPAAPSASPQAAAPLAAKTGEAVGVPSHAALPPDLAKIVWTARDDDRVMDHLRMLTGTIGPRLTGSKNAATACEWAREQFQSFGLEARVEKWGEFPIGFERSASSGRMLAPEEKALVFATNAWTPGTNGAVAGPAVLMPKTVEEVEQNAARLHGAWVIAPAPAGPGGPQSAPAAASQPSREEREKIDAALDAVGVAGRVRGARGELVLTGGNYQVNPDKLPTRVQITLRNDQYKEIAGLLDAGRDVRLEFDVRNTFVPGPAACSNVIADLPGSELPDELVIIGGHLDSWDGATGATDNGTGVATTLEVARLLKKSGVKPKRTIRFMLWTGEEQGLLGSRAYVAAHKDEMPKISAVIVHDEGTNYVAGINATKAQKALLEPILAPLGTLDPEMPFRVVEVEALPRPGSDHESFLDAGVPGFFWIQEGKSNYNHGHHTQYDTIDAVIPEYQRHSAMVIACAAVAIADLDAKLPREGINSPRGMAGGRRFIGVVTGEGMKVEQVTADFPADKAGIREGDVILKVGDAAVANQAELRTAIRAAGAKTTVTVRRGDKEMVLLMELPERPASRPAAPATPPAESKPAGT